VVVPVASVSAVCTAAIETGTYDDASNSFTRSPSDGDMGISPQKYDCGHYFARYGRVYVVCSPVRASVFVAIAHSAATSLRHVSAASRCTTHRRTSRSSSDGCRMSTRTARQFQSTTRDQREE
jgi:hypothetical protein